MPSLKTSVELQFGARCGRPPQGVQFAPGRVLLLGEHLPWVGGPLLAVPLEQGVACAWGLRPDSRVVVWSMTARQKDSFHLASAIPSGRPWADLARGAYTHVARGAPRMPGLDLLVEGDLPQGEGLASSAAYLVVLLRSMFEAVGVYRSKWELAEDVPAVELAWRGRRSDGASAYVVAAARPQQVLYLDCRHLDHEALELPPGCAVRTEPAAAGPDAAPDAGAWDRRRLELAAADEEARALRPGLLRLPDLSPAAFAALEGRMSPTGGRRARYVVQETHRVSRAYDALQAGDAAKLGRLVHEGHAGLARDFETSTPAIDRQVEQAMARPGVLGARLNGPGWSGRLVLLERTPHASAR